MRMELVDTAIEMYLAEDEQGRKLPVSKICAELGIYPPELYQMLDLRDIPRRSVESGMRPPTALSGRGVIEMNPALTKIGVDKEVLRRSRMRIERMYSEEVHKRVVKMYNDEGITAKDISITLTMPYTHVLRLLHSARIEVTAGKGSYRSWKKIRDVVLKDFTGGVLTIEEILAKHTITRSVLWRVIRGEYQGLVDTKMGVSKRDLRTSALVEEVLLRVREELKTETGKAGLGDITQGRLLNEWDFDVEEPSSVR